MSVVIKGGKSPWGVLGAHSTRKRNFTIDDTHFLQAMANIMADAIEREQVLIALKKSEKRFHALYDNNPSMFFTIDPEGNVLSVNDYGAAHLGYTRENLIGKSVLDLCHEEDKQTALNYVKQCVACVGNVQHWELRKIHKQGTIIDVRETARAFRDKDGNIEILIICDDITEQKVVERKSLQTQEMLSTFVKFTPVAVAMFDKDMCYLAHSKRWVSDYKLDTDDLRGLSHYEVFPDLLEEWKQDHQRALAGEIVKLSENEKFPRADGSLMWIRREYHPWYDADGNVGGIIVFEEVTTDRIMAELKLKRSIRALRVLSACNAAVTKTVDELQLIGEVCEIVVSEGNYWFAWVGYPQNDTIKTVKPMAFAGHEMAYLENSDFISWDENNARGRGPVGTAIRTKEITVIQDITKDPRFEPWREQALERGYRSIISIPLLVASNVIGVITIYADIVDAFNEEEFNLLVELADNLALGIHSLRTDRAILESYENLRNLTAKLHAAREEERTRISHEIHDELGQSLTGLRIDMVWLLDELPAGEQALRIRTRKSLMLVDETLDSVRRISHDLRPAMLDDLGLESAIEWQMEEFQERTNCDYDLLIEADDIGIEKERDTVIFRILQETLTNVVRHAHANFVKVTLQKKIDNLVLTVEDNGIGINEEKITSQHSIGLIGMRERVMSVGGRIQFYNGAKNATCVNLIIPMDSTLDHVK